MKKLKLTLTLLLAVLILALGALLPYLLACLQDAHSQNQTAYADIHSVTLTMQEEETLSIPGKLSLLWDVNVVETSENNASMTAEELEAVIRKVLAPYTRNGMLNEQELTAYSLSCKPCLMFLTDNPGLYAIGWGVSLASPDYSRLINMVIDDETGTLLSINYTSDAPVYGESSLFKWLDTFSCLYFDALPFTVQPAGEGAPSEEQSYQTVLYRLSDTEYGEINIRLTVSTNGFSVEFEPPGGLPGGLISENDAEMMP